MTIMWEVEENGHKCTVTRAVPAVAGTPPLYTMWCSCGEKSKAIDSRVRAIQAGRAHLKLVERLAEVSRDRALMTKAEVRKAMGLDVNQEIRETPPALVPPSGLAWEPVERVEPVATPDLGALTQIDHTHIIFGTEDSWSVQHDCEASKTGSCDMWTRIADLMQSRALKLPEGSRWSVLEITGESTTRIELTRIDGVIDTFGTRIV